MFSEILSFYTQSNRSKIICYTKTLFISAHSATEVFTSLSRFVRKDLSHLCSKDQDEIVKQTSPMYKKRTALLG